ncbi:MAG TPA: lipopolysaccharide heptosyltransferase II, partial [Phycisphaerales bacterium]|nr:lipopolysaccharide heptosyltransferase II [Phycisphaerales bacterium]
MNRGASHQRLYHNLILISNSLYDVSVPILATDLQRLCVILPSWVGDCVMATPALRALHAHCPKARITLTCRPGLDGLLAGLPFAREFITTSMSSFRGPFRLASVIRAKNPQAVILMPNSLRSAFAARLTRSPIRAGYDRDSRRFLLTHPIPLPTPSRTHPIPAIDYYLNLISMLTDVRTTDRTMSLTVSPSEMQSVQPLIASIPRPFIVLCPGGNKLQKRWPARNFAQLADALLQASSAKSIAIIGSPSESPIAQEIISAVNPNHSSSVVNLIGKTRSLSDLKPILQSASLLVTNDTGPRHIALALSTPVVTLFGPTDHRWTTTYSPRERIIL